ncbi:unnamed protein product, partial [Rotaria socialis]
MRIVIQREIEQGHTPENEVQIYTWMNATLGELTQLIKEVNPDTRRIEKTENGQLRSDDQMQLAHKRFRIADSLDVAIRAPRGMGWDAKNHPMGRLKYQMFFKVSNFFDYHRS